MTAAFNPSATAMFREAEEGAATVARFTDTNAVALRRIGARLRDRAPACVVTVGRGSSDHAATYGKYVFETLTGVPTATAALSVASIFARRPAIVPGSLCVAISQSGQSPDLVAGAKAYRDAGAFVVALVNNTDSPLAELADEVLPLMAGPERSVAATKSCIASLAGLAALAAAWSGEKALDAGLACLPEDLSRAFALDWSAALDLPGDRANLFVLGRGYSYGVAQEAALKLKETCGLHAESFSAAEVKHGPMAIVRDGFPVLALATSDAAGDMVRQVAGEFAGRGARVMLADSAGGPAALPTIRAEPMLEPILMLQSFYRFANALSLSRGFDPDTPPFLNKVTETA